MKSTVRSFQTKLAHKPSEVNCWHLHRGAQRGQAEGKMVYHLLLGRRQIGHNGVHNVGVNQGNCPAPDLDAHHHGQRLEQCQRRLVRGLSDGKYLAVLDF
jgi:hypothetical protein